MSVQDIVSQMPPEVRAQATSQAAANGQSLEDYVRQNMSAELSDEELDNVCGGDDTFDWLNPNGGG